MERLIVSLWYSKMTEMTNANASCHYREQLQFSRKLSLQRLMSTR
jgi:hypothetical protein